LLDGPGRHLEFGMSSAFVHLFLSEAVATP
jgi:hypothetical protein